MAGQNIDNDPNGWPLLLGITDHQSSQVTLVFLEVHRDGASANVLDEAQELAKTTAHEVGHQFNVAATPNEHRPNTDNIMYGSGTFDVTGANIRFLNEDVAFLRLEHRSPGSR